MLFGPRKENCAGPDFSACYLKLPDVISRHPAERSVRPGPRPDNPDHFDGAIAQLGERLHGMQEVSGSIPLSSTKFLIFIVQTANHSRIGCAEAADPVRGRLSDQREDL